MTTTAMPAYRTVGKAKAAPRREVAMPEFGPGATLRIQIADMQALWDTFGEGYFLEAADRCNAVDVAFIAAVIERAGRLDGERVPLNIEDHPEIPLATFAQRALDALYLAVHGRTFEEELRGRILASAPTTEGAEGEAVVAGAE